MKGKEMVLEVQGKEGVAWDVGELHAVKAVRPISHNRVNDRLLKQIWDVFWHEHRGDLDVFNRNAQHLSIDCSWKFRGGYLTLEFLEITSALGRYRADFSRQDNEFGERVDTRSSGLDLTVEVCLEKIKDYLSDVACEIEGKRVMVSREEADYASR
jgi:hypothetical protein